MLYDQKKSSLKIIEVGLAKARAAIREAIRSRRCMSQKEETFIPRGSIYRNPYAFHQLSLKDSQVALLLFTLSY
jgi:xylogalacturonan beta-1,3-xylosyltransferase